jgi:flavin-dependent dehydrogenase
MRLRCDVLIIGGGPGGIATALALQRQGVQVVVAERSHYEVVRSGEWLQGASAPLLSALGLGNQLTQEHGLLPAPIKSYWGSHDADNSTPRGWFIDRTVFDATLAREAEAAGALVYCNVRPCDSTRVRQGWTTTLASNGVRVSVQARYVVDATGRSAWMARRAGARPGRVDKMVALIGKYKHAPDERTLLIEAVRDGWWYSVPQSGEGTLAVYLTDQDFRSDQSQEEFYRTHLAETDHTQARVRSLGSPSIRTVPASTYAFDRCAGQRWLSVGEAAFAIDPLSGSGISLALESGLRAANALAACLRGKRTALADYECETQAVFVAQLSNRQHYYRLETRWPASLFWSRRQQ